MVTVNLGVFISTILFDNLFILPPLCLFFSPFLPSFEVLGCSFCFLLLRIYMVCFVFLSQNSCNSEPVLARHVIYRLNGSASIFHVGYF
jgi:hypothetical protein